MLGNRKISKPPRWDAAHARWACLVALRNETGLKLTWSAAFTNQALESATGLGDAWSEVLVTPTLVGDQSDVDQPTTNSTRFYRLRGR